MQDTDIAVHVPDLRGGGAERMMVNLANEFVSRGISTELVLSRIEGPYLSEVSEEVKLVNLEASRYPGYSAMGSCRPLYKYLHEVEPTTMLSALTRANVVALLAHRLASVDTRIVVSERNHLSSIVTKSGDVRMRSLPWLVRATYRWADAIVPISEGVGEDLVETAGVNPKIMTTIYNPALPPEVESRSREPLQHQWVHERDEDEVLLLGVGSLSKQKDFSSLLRAFNRIQERRPARLLILGEGDKRNSLEALAEHLGITDRVYMPGFVDNPFPYMREADVFVLSSKWEGFGNVLVEAMACGTPVVSTDCPSGPAEILEEGKYGPLVPVGDAEALAEAIHQALNDPPNPDQLQSRAQDFSVSAIADQYLDVLLPER